MSILSLNYSILYKIQSVNERFALLSRIITLQLNRVTNTTEKLKQYLLETMSRKIQFC